MSDEHGKKIGPLCFEYYAPPSASLEDSLSSSVRKATLVGTTALALQASFVSLGSLSSMDATVYVGRKPDTSGRVEESGATEKSQQIPDTLLKTQLRSRSSSKSAPALVTERKRSFVGSAILETRLASSGEDKGPSVSSKKPHRGSPDQSKHEGNKLSASASTKARKSDRTDVHLEEWLRQEDWMTILTAVRSKQIDPNLFIVDPLTRSKYRVPLIATAKNPTHILHLASLGAKVDVEWTVSITLNPRKSKGPVERVLTPLHYHCMKLRSKAVSALLHLGARPDGAMEKNCLRTGESWEGSTPLLSAVKRIQVDGDGPSPAIDIAQILLKSGANATVIEPGSKLSAAAILRVQILWQRRDGKMVRLEPFPERAFSLWATADLKKLLRRWDLADPAVLESLAAQAIELLRYGADPNACLAASGVEVSLLCLAACSAKARLVEEVLESGADPRFGARDPATKKIILTPLAGIKDSPNRHQPDHEKVVGMLMEALRRHQSRKE